jgi:hypothetical protein
MITAGVFTSGPATAGVSCAAEIPAAPATVPPASFPMNPRRFIGVSIRHEIRSFTPKLHLHR